MRFVRILICILVVFSLTACGTAPAAEPAMENTIDNMGIEPDFNYVRELQVSHICLDEEGYLPSSKKVFYVYGEDLQNEFGILDASGDEAIYSGTLSCLSDPEADGNKLYVGDFSSLSEEGEYRIFQPDVGYSDSFRVDAGVYRRLYRDTLDKIKNYEYITNSEMIYPLAAMMTTSEIYKGADVDVSYISKCMDYLYSQQDARTGGIYAEYVSPDDLEDYKVKAKESGTVFDPTSLISLATTAQYAGLMAQYITDFPDEVGVNRSLYIQSASRAYSYVERYRDSADADSRYYAACELYRLTGQYNYRNSILSANMEEISRKDEDYLILGNIAYLNTSFKTEYQLCEKIMGDFMKRASDISMSTSRDSFYVQKDIADCTKSQILDNMIALGLVSYVLSGNEYASIEYNYLHYLCGNNEGRINYLAEMSQNPQEDISSNAVLLGKMLFILGSDYIEQE